MVTTKVFALHADGLGSVRAVTDPTGAAVERTAYRPYGEELAQVLAYDLNGNMTPGPRRQGDGPGRRAGAGLPALDLARAPA
ncbi:hypothetical protein [Albidovulum sp.]|uniref:hypothetical protein n=1 Tax=Albidovulum sp. TaxID=1872424 RepID=UPI0039B86375